MEWDEQGSPFEDVSFSSIFVRVEVTNQLQYQIRKSFFAALNTLFSAPPPPSSMRRADDKS